MNKVRKIVVGCVIALLVVGSPFVAVAGYFAWRKTQLNEDFVNHIRETVKKQGPTLVSELVSGEWDTVCVYHQGYAIDIETELSRVLKKPIKVVKGEGSILDNEGAIIFVDTNKQEADVRLTDMYAFLVEDVLVKNTEPNNLFKQSPCSNRKDVMKFKVKERISKYGNESYTFYDNYVTD